MAFDQNGLMTDDGIEIELLKLRDGRRLLRLSHQQSGLALERMIEPSRSVAAQKQELAKAFAAAIAQAQLSAA